MSDTLIGTPGSVQRDIATRIDRVTSPTAVSPSQLSDHATRAEIALLAYLPLRINVSCMVISAVVRRKSVGL
jgi:hypothetical protein